MPRLFVRQPDGLYAVFGTISDDFTHWGLSHSDALEEAAVAFDEAHAMQAVELADAATGIMSLAPIPGEGSHRWRAALTRIALLKGGARLRARLAEMGLAHAELPLSALDAARDFDQRIIAT